MVLGGTKMYKTLFMCLILMATEANAQMFTSVGTNGQISTSMPLNGNTAFSSTAQGDILRGEATYITAQGQFIHNLGVYESLHESARKQYLQNNMAAIQNRLVLKEQTAARRAAQPDAIDRENVRLDKIQKMAELKKRKNQMIKDGLLDVPHSQIGYHGQYFKNIDEFKKSSFWQELVAEGEARTKAYNDELEVKKERDAAALLIIAKYRNMTSVDIARQENLKRAVEILSRK